MLKEIDKEATDELSIDEFK